MRYAALLLCLLLTGCWRSTGSEVVVYTSSDSEFSAPIFQKFTSASGVTVLPKYDAESTKTVGLAEAIVAERLARDATFSGTTKSCTPCG